MQPTAQAVGKSKKEAQAPKGRKKKLRPDTPGPPDSRGRLSPHGPSFCVGDGGDCMGPSGGRNARLQDDKA